MALASFEINIWAVIVSTIIYFVLGMLWYSPKLFGKSWMALQNFTEEKMAEMKSKGMAKSMILGLIGAFITSLILAYIISVSGATIIGEGLWIGFLVWLGFIATVIIGSVLWEGKPFKLYMINVGYHLVSLLIMSLILTVWV